jgi:hypothetical protein
MKVVIDIDLDDLLEEVEDEESGNTYYQVKKDSMLEDDIRYKIKETVINRVRCDNYSTITNSINNLIKECKSEIVDEVVKQVSKKIIESKAIHDFRKQLKEMENSFIEKVKDE